MIRLFCLAVNIVCVFFLMTGMSQAADQKVEKLIAQLKDSNLSVRIEACRQLAKLGKKAAQADKELNRLAFDGFVLEGQQPALDALCKVRPDLGPHIAVFHKLEAKPEMFVEAAKRIGELGSGGTLGTQALMRGLRTFDKAQRNDPSIVKACIVALGEVQTEDNEAFHNLGQCLALNAVAELRCEAIRAMGKICLVHKDRTTDLLKYTRIALNDSDNSVRIACLETMAQLGKEAKAIEMDIKKLENDPDLAEAVKRLLKAISN